MKIRLFLTAAVYTVSLIVLALDLLVWRPQ